MDLKLTPENRSRNMSKIRGTDTKPEIIVRKFLFSKGLRFRKNDKRYPGTPDIVLPKYNTIIFVNGCFWHGHAGCRNFTMPKTNSEFWNNKLNANVIRDHENYETLKQMGWHVLVIWECELEGPSRHTNLENLYQKIAGTI